ncbi:MAG: penicillin-binding protein 2 [Candidatus Margulisbacteria bacterium]|jgi:cell division protein FtsI/penicillin-binding protein 2|nr:penicillin-binding protein 2 [Candidatus Margulisiibacteriota bacterium]
MVKFERLRGVSLFLALLFLLVVGRLFYLQVWKHQDYQAMSQEQLRQEDKQPAKRGSITDRNGILLAATVAAKTANLDSTQIPDPQATAAQIAAALDLKPDAVYEKIKKQRHFPLKRWISAAEENKLKALNIRGVHFTDDQRRVYLRGNLAAHVLGFVNFDDQGAAGLEYSLDRYLQGIPGKLLFEKDVRGQELYLSNRIVVEPRDGDNIQLTIDEFLQYISRKYLAAALQETRADSGSALIMDTRSGQILALVSLPDYDPNQYFKYSADNLRNNAAGFNYEPGSVFKIITVAAALELGLATPNTTFINGNVFEHASRQIRESHPLKDPDRPRYLKDILIESLNITSAKLALAIGKNKMHEIMHRFRLDQRTGILPGEEAGLLAPLDKVDAHSAAVYGFGQAFSVTPLQMLAAVNVIANDGVYVKPSLVQKIYDNNGDVLKDFTLRPEKQRVISPQTARAIRLMLQEAVQKGTGTLAGIPGYSIGGKTGTSQKARPHGGGYYANDYISSFCGLVPGLKPQLTILVVIDNPRNRQHQGGYVAAPVFREIAREAARYLAIPEDL